MPGYTGRSKSATMMRRERDRKIAGPGRPCRSAESAAARRGTARRRAAAGGGWGRHGQDPRDYRACPLAARVQPGAFRRTDPRADIYGQAAAEMKYRVVREVAERGKQVWLSTFHA